jgi:glycosyltransferase involved in cell wall biosynthesis
MVSDHGQSAMMERPVPPDISVLMPIHNGRRHLEASLQSLLDQTLPSWELVAVLDRCTDDTRKILEAAKDDRIRITETSTPGIVAALNHGLQLCRADFVARLDADDICEPFRLAVQYAYLRKRPNVAAVGSSATLIDDDGRVVGRRIVVSGRARVIRRLLWRNALIHPSVTFRRDIVMSLGGYNLACQWAEDYELWLRLARAMDVDNIQVPLLRYRVHPAQISRGFRLRELPFRTLAAARLRAAKRAGISPLGAMARHVVWYVAQARRI